MIGNVGMSKMEAERRKQLARHVYTDIGDSYNNTGYHLFCFIADEHHNSLICDDGDCRTCLIANAYAMGRTIEWENRGRPGEISAPDSVSVGSRDFEIIAQGRSKRCQKLIDEGKAKERGLVR
jgi:hypothetical protein